MLEFCGHVGFSDVLEVFPIPSGLLPDVERISSNDVISNGVSLNARRSTMVVLENEHRYKKFACFAIISNFQKIFRMQNFLSTCLFF